jgi:hypothetical protein
VHVPHEFHVPAQFTADWLVQDCASGEAGQAVPPLLGLVVAVKSLLWEPLEHAPHELQVPAQFEQLCDSGEEGHWVPLLLAAWDTVYDLVFTLPSPHDDQLDQDPSQFVQDFVSGEGQADPPLLALVVTE